MRPPVSTKRIRIGVLSSHPLAVSQIILILGRSHQFKVQPVEIDWLIQETKIYLHVLIVDIGSLRKPLSSYLSTSRFNSNLLVVGERPDDVELSVLLQFGLRGFVHYDELRRGLLPAVRAVSEGLLWIPANMLRGLGRITTTSPTAGVSGDGLTGREKLVFELLRKRLSNKEIASQLLISPNTVKFHTSNIFRKLRVPDRYSIGGQMPSTS